MAFVIRHRRATSSGIGDGDPGQIIIADPDDGPPEFVDITGDIRIDDEGVTHITDSYVNSCFMSGETPVGTIDGTNQEFTLSKTPIQGTQIVVLNGIVLADDTSADYTISGPTITFTDPPIDEDVIQVNYIASSPYS